MKIGDKVLITGGVEIDWLKNIKPWYLTLPIDNDVSKAYRNKEECTISDITVCSNNEKVFDVLNSKGEKLFGFSEWELSLINNEY